MDAQIRAFSPADAERIAALLRAHGWQDRYIAGQLDALSALGDSRHGAALVAAVDGDLAGYVALEIHRWNGLGQIQGLAVHPAQLRRRIGTHLVETAERFGREHGCRGVYVDTPVDNEGGRAFYAALGYREDYRMTRYYADDLDGVTYVKFFD